MLPEAKLTKVEQGVLAAFRADGLDIDVVGAETRGEFLRGLFLGGYDEKADYRGTCIVNANIVDVLEMEFCETKFPVRFRACCFAKEISFQQLTCPELDFSGCILKNGFDARMVKVAGGVDMKEVDAEYTVDFDGAEIGGQLNCSGGNLRPRNKNNKSKVALTAQSIKVTGDVFLRNGFNAVGEVRLPGAKIGSQLDCSGGIFQNEGKIALNAEGIQVTGGVLLRNGFRSAGGVKLLGAEIRGQLNCEGGSFQNEDKIALNARCVKVATNVDLCGKFNGRVSFAGADIGGQLDCAGGNFQNEKGVALNAQGIRVASDVFLNDGFKSVGEVSLLGADIKGQLVCIGGSFQNEGKISLNAQSMKVASGVFLSANDSDSEHAKTFMAEGRVDLAGAEIGGQLNCEGGIFQNKGSVAFNAQDTKVTAGIFLGKGFKSDGVVNLLGAEIHGQLECMGGSFQNKDGTALIAQGIKVTSNVFLAPHFNEEKGEWENFSANGCVFFTNATIGGNLLLSGCKFTHLSLAGTNILGEFWDDANIYKDIEGLNIDGFRYQRLSTTKERIANRLKWVGLMSQGDEFRPQPYEQLMKVYREMGHMNWARKVGFELEKKRHKQLRLNRDHKHFVVLGWAWWMWYWILRGTIGYGYKPFRAITRWFIPLIVAGFVLFSGALPCPDSCRAGSESCHCMAPSDADVLLSDDWKIHGKLPKDYPGFNPVYYAVEAALPVLPLGQTENWHPKIPWVRWVQGAITIIGALVLTILASYGVGVLGPRWKDE